MDSYSAMRSRTCLQFVEQLVDGELGEAIELEFEDGVDLTKGEALFLVRQRSRSRSNT